MTSKQIQEVSTNNRIIEDELHTEEELLTLNIFGLLPCDLQLFILTFLTINDLYRVSLSCQHGSYLVLSPDTDEYVWKLIASRLLGVGDHIEEQEKSKNEQQAAVTNSEKNSPLFNGCIWRALVCSNMIHWDPHTRTPDSDIKMHNRNKTISCEKDSRWYTIRANRKLDMGKVHCWEYTLDDHDNGSYNAFRMFVGIEISTFVFTEHNFNNIIGYNTHGISYNIGQHSVQRNASHSEHANDSLREKFKTGDTIAMMLDLRNLSSETASMYLFKNNEYFQKIEDIPTQGIMYYPAISVIGHQWVSIGMKNPSMLNNNPIA